MQPEGMQKGRETLHDEEDGDRQDGEDGKDDEDPNEPSPAPKAEADVHHHGPEHLGQLCGSKWDILSHQVCMYPSFSSITSNAKAPLRATQELASIRVRGPSNKRTQTDTLWHTDHQGKFPTRAINSSKRNQT